MQDRRNNATTILALGAPRFPCTVTTKNDMMVMSDRSSKFLAHVRGESADCVGSRGQQDDVIVGQHFI